MGILKTIAMIGAAAAAYKAVTAPTTMFNGEVRVFKFQVNSTGGDYCVYPEGTVCLVIDGEAAHDLWGVNEMYFYEVRPDDLDKTRLEMASKGYKNYFRPSWGEVLDSAE